MVAVIIPWRPTPSRVAAFNHVSAWYRENLPGARILTADSDDVLFNLAAARNFGISGEPADDVVVISDADTFPAPGPLRAAIDAAATSGLVHLPYTEYHWLGRSGTAALLAGADPVACDFELVRGACSGVYVTTPETWWAHGGQDERFRGWGFEDTAWYIAHGTLLGAPPQRHEGRVFAMHHETQLREGLQYDLNAALADRYRAAEGDADAMRQLVEEESALKARSRPGMA